MGCNCSCSEPKQEKILEQQAISQSVLVSKSISKTVSSHDNDNIGNNNKPKGNVIIYKNGMRQNTEKKNYNKSIYKVLENQMLKEKALNLCKEHEELSEHGEDSGFITFVNKYLSQKLIDQLYIKCDVIDDEITSLDELQSLITITIILYKSHVTQIKNMVFDEVNQNRTRFQKSEITPVAKYISYWIFDHYNNDNGDGDDDDDNDEFYIAKEEFSDKLSKYLRNFVRSEWKTFSSMMSVSHI